MRERERKSILTVAKQQIILGSNFCKYNICMFHFPTALGYVQHKRTKQKEIHTIKEQQS